MSFMNDVEYIKDEVVIFRRTDVKHRRWYCRIRIDDVKKYKTISLKTDDVTTARNKALDAYAEIRFKISHELPVFDKSFNQVAREFLEIEKERSEAGQISIHRWKVMEGHIRVQISKYLGNTQITQIGEDRWLNYSPWRIKTGKGRSGGRVSDGTIRDEMTTFRSVIKFAARKKYIRDSQVFRGKLPVSQVKREEFTATEYRKLRGFVQGWIRRAVNKEKSWYRTVIWNFILVMTNTGMRPTEARSLCWSDISRHKEKDGAITIRMSVWGKNKRRILVAHEEVWTYLERIREISKAPDDEDHVFTTYNGTPSRSLYGRTIRSLLEEVGLLFSSSGSRRSTYCFRHTYATFRLAEGVDVYYLADQMGTSVKMIEDYYGHATAVSNADKVLKGMGRHRR
jgi:integrase